MLKETTISNNTKVNNTTRVATNPPDQPTRVAKYPSQAKTEELKISANEERGGKASGKTTYATCTEAGELQGELITTTSRAFKTTPQGRE